MFAAGSWLSISAADDCFGTAHEHTDETNREATGRHRLLALAWHAWYERLANFSRFVRTTNMVTQLKMELSRLQIRFAVSKEILHPHVFSFNGHHRKARVCLKPGLQRRFWKSFSRLNGHGSHGNLWNIQFSDTPICHICPIEKESPKIDHFRNWNRPGLAFQVTWATQQRHPKTTSLIGAFLAENCPLMPWVTQTTSAHKGGIAMVIWSRKLVSDHFETATTARTMIMIVYAMFCSPNTDTYW